MAPKYWLFILIFILIISPGKVISQDRYNDYYGQLNYSNLDSWYIHLVKESFFIGGENRKLFEIGKENDAYTGLTTSTESPWGTTNVHAKILIDIACPCVFPETRLDGYCCRLETNIKGVHIIGVTINALVTGAIFLGDFLDPVKSTKSPEKGMNNGIPFTRRPKAVKFDYKCAPGQNRINTSSNEKQVPGPDMAEFCTILQRRWEDQNGKVFATRVGGIRAFFNSTKNEWINGATFELKYGDITREPYYDSKTMGLIPSVGPMYVKNSKGVMVPLIETSWDKADATPTHLVMYFSSSYQGIYFIGSPESRFWVDNISLIY
jgi:hypothetical protein